MPPIWCEGPIMPIGGGPVADPPWKFTQGGLTADAGPEIQISKRFKVFLYHLALHQVLLFPLLYSIEIQKVTTADK